MTRLVRVAARIGPHDTEMPPRKVREDMDRKENGDAPRMARARALEIADAMARKLSPYVARLAYAGSLRRGRDTVGDVDILIVPSDGSWIERVLEESGSVIGRGETRVLIALPSGERMDVFATVPESWGAALQYLTGSRWHNISLRKRAQGMGLLLNEYGVWRGEECIASEREGDVYAALGLRWVPPTCRHEPIGRGWERVPRMS